MTILKRIGDILRDDLNEILGKVESPEAVLDRMVRDMERAVLELRKNVASAIAQQRTSERRLATAESEKTRWRESAAKAVADGDDALARQALRKAFVATSSAEALAAQVRSEQELVDRLNAELQLVEERIQEVRTRRETLMARKRAEASRERQFGGHEDSRRSGGASGGFEALQRMEEAVERLIAESDASAELKRCNAKLDELEKEFAELRDGLDVDAELAKLKEELRG